MRTHLAGDVMKKMKDFPRQEYWEWYRDILIKGKELTVGEASKYWWYKGQLAVK